MKFKKEKLIKILIKQKSSISIMSSEIEEKVKKYVEVIIDELNNNNLKLFKDQPTVYTFRVDENTLGLSLIDEGKSTIEVNLNQNSQSGKKYLFLNKTLSIETLEIDAKIKAKELIQEEIEENAYKLNLERVNELINNKHFSVALVFIVSAFENALKDIFFRHNYLWFKHIENKSYNFEDDLFQKYAIKIKGSMERQYWQIREIDGEQWGLMSGNKEWLYKWGDSAYKEYVFKICYELRIFNDYLMKLIGTKFVEIRSYDILKNLLEKLSRSSRGINFQRFKDIGGVNWCFNKFYELEFTDLNKEVEILKSVIKKRHRIIHGFLDDNQISKEEVEEARDALVKFISFVKDKIYEIFRKFYS